MKDGRVFMFARGAGWEVAKLEKRTQVPRARFSSCGAVEWMEGVQEWSEKLANTKNAPHDGARLLCLPERQCGKQPNSKNVQHVHVFRVRVQWEGWLR